MKKNIKIILLSFVSLLANTTVKARSERRPTEGQKEKHTEIVAQFKQLQKDIGISRYETPRKNSPISEQRGSFSVINKLQSQLNTLLSKTVLDVNKITEKINELADQEPAQWPRAADYKDLLDVRRAKDQDNITEGSIDFPS